MKYNVGKVDINIKSKQIYDENDTNNIDVMTDGILSYNDDEVKLSYDEFLVEDASYKTSTTLSFNPNEKDIIYMKREGDVVSSCIFEKGKRYKFFYQFPFGLLELTIATKTLENTLSPDGGELKLAYTTELAGSVLNENILNLSIKPEKVVQERQKINDMLNQYKQ